MAKDPYANVEADAEKIFVALGKALTQWSVLEDALCTMFCLAMGDPKMTTSAQAFWAIMSFDGS